jgi:hypothetical protein
VQRDEGSLWLVPVSVLERFLRRAKLLSIHARSAFNESGWSLRARAEMIHVEAGEATPDGPASSPDRFVAAVPET